MKINESGRMSRRSFVKGFGAVGAVALAAGGLAGCSNQPSSLSATGSTPQDSSAVEYPGLIDQKDFALSVVEVDPIEEFVEEATYDIVVVGAGVAGVPAVLTALDEGASVACLQKEPEASANGHYEGSLVLEESDPNDILIWQQSIRANNGYRVNWDLLSYYAAHSGERFMNEEIAMTLWHNSCDSLVDQPDPGVFVRVFDDAFETKMADFDFGTRDMLEAYIPENNVSDYTGVTNWTLAFADVHKADTLEELADILGVPADALVKSVEKWNEYCAAGEDPEFGVSQRYLKSIDTPPYWGINQHVRVIATNAGVEVNENYQVVDGDNQPIPGLFAVGTTGGNVCANIDWRMSFGLSNSHCMTAGRYSVIYALTGGLEPTNPAKWEDVRHLYNR